MTVFIFLNGNIPESAYYKNHFHSLKKNEDTVICADGGYNLACSAGIRPDYVVGDFDSVQETDIDNGIEILKYPAEKDFSDFELALKNALRMKPSQIVVYGALGGRLDHELTNILLLAHTAVPMVFIEKSVEIYNVGKRLVLENKKGQVCSLIALSGPCQVARMEGFQYLLHDEVLLPSSRGLSNIITTKKAVLHIKRGTLIVVVDRSNVEF